MEGVRGGTGRKEKSNVHERINVVNNVQEKSLRGRE